MKEKKHPTTAAYYALNAIDSDITNHPIGKKYTEMQFAVDNFSFLYSNRSKSISTCKHMYIIIVWQPQQRRQISCHPLVRNFSVRFHLFIAVLYMDVAWCLRNVLSACILSIQRESRVCESFSTRRLVFASYF